MKVKISVGVKVRVRNCDDLWCLNYRCKNVPEKKF